MAIRSKRLIRGSVTGALLVSGVITLGILGWMHFQPMLATDPLDDGYRQCQERIATMRDRMSSGELSVVRTASADHARSCLEFAREAEAARLTDREDVWMRRVGEAEEDMRLAQMYLQLNDPAGAARLALDLWRYLELLGDHQLASDFIYGAMASNPKLDDGVSIDLRLAAAILMAKDRLHRQAKAFAAACYEDAYNAADEARMAESLRVLGFCEAYGHRPVHAARFYYRALRQFEANHDEKGMAMTMLGLAQVRESSTVSTMQATESQAKWAQNALVLLRKLGSRWGSAMALAQLDRAGATMFSKYGDGRWGRIVLDETRAGLSGSAWSKDPNVQRPYRERALKLAAMLGDEAITVEMLSWFASDYWRLSRRDSDRALIIGSWIERHAPGLDREWIAEARAEVRQRSGDEGANHIEEFSENLTREEVIALALQKQPGVTD